MDRMIYCNLEHATFPESEFVASIFGTIHKTPHPHNTHGAPVILEDNGFVRLEKTHASYPVRTARSRKDFSRIDPKGKFESRKVQPRPSPK